MQKTVRNLLLIAVTLFVCNIGKVDALETSAHCVYNAPLKFNTVLGGTGVMEHKITINIHPGNEIEYDSGVPQWDIATVSFSGVINEYYILPYNFITDDGFLTCPNSIYIQSEDVTYNDILYKKLSYYASQNDLKSGEYAEGILVESESKTFTSEEDSLQRVSNACRYKNILLFYDSEKMKLNTVAHERGNGVGWAATVPYIDWNFDHSDLPETCPSEVYVSEKWIETLDFAIPGVFVTKLETNVSLEPKNGYSKIELSTIPSASELGFNSNVMINKTDKKIEFTNCSVFGDPNGPLSNIVKWIVDLIQIMIPILIIILTIVDFSSIVLSGEEKNFKAAGTKFIKRLIIGAAIILLPMLLTFIIDMSGVLGSITHDQLFCSLF